MRGGCEGSEALLVAGVVMGKVQAGMGVPRTPDVVSADMPAIKFKARNNPERLLLMFVDLCTQVISPVHE